jgi:hypothetical protein
MPAVALLPRDYAIREISHDENLTTGTANTKSNRQDLQDCAGLTRLNPVNLEKILLIL